MTSCFTPLVPGSTTVPLRSVIFVSSVMMSCLLRWKCNISDFESSNGTALSCAHWNAVLAAASKRRAFPALMHHVSLGQCRPCSWGTKRQGGRCRGHRTVVVSKHRKSTGDAGGPSGMPVVTGHCWSVCLSKESAMVLNVRNVEHQESMGFGQLSCRIVWSSLVVETLSKVPQMSRKRVEVLRCVAFPMSISCISAIAASMANLCGRPPIWSWCRRSWASAMVLRRVAMSFSSTFPRQLRRAIGRYALGLL
jgi:hypothetical protein